MCFGKREMVLRPDVGGRGRVPTLTGKPGKMGRHFQSGKSQGILNRLEKSGKITQNTGKVREFQANIICYFFNDI